MKGYILSTIKNTHDWVAYDNDLSIDYKEFLKGRLFTEKELPLFYHVQKKSNLNKIKSSIILESSGAPLINKPLKEVLEANTKKSQFFDVELYCDSEKIEGFYALNVTCKIPCVDIEKSEYRLMNFDVHNPNYMFYYMKLKEDIFTDGIDHDIVICEEMSRYLIVSEKIKKALFEAKLKGLQFSDSIDMTPQNRTVYEIIM
ncbi:MAG: hypothetical protein LBE91_07020 [Tannerella sp.]|jgi:hypothetical protein|nr:hypothetical protein [Tannerella sp.]